MRFEVMVYQSLKLPDGPIPVIKDELIKFLTYIYSNLKLHIHRADSDSQKVRGAKKSHKKPLCRCFRSAGKVLKIFCINSVCN